MLKLNNSKIQIGEVYTFKLVTGEEVLGKVEQIDESSVVLVSPMQLASSAQGVGLAPAFYTAADHPTATYQMTAFIAYFEPSDQFRTAYSSAVTGMQLPSKKIII